MKQSVFDVNSQNLIMEYRIVASLEKLSEVFRVLLWQESKKTGLSPIQIQILTFILYQPAKMATVTSLAHAFNLTKPTISDSIKALQDKNLVIRTYPSADNRTFTLSLSAHGKSVAKASSLFANIIGEKVQSLQSSDKSRLLSSLLEIIYQLNKEGIISQQRMCQTCRFFAPRNRQSYCKLMDRILSIHELRLDCPEHELTPKL